MNDRVIDREKERQRETERERESQNEGNTGRRSLRRLRDGRH